ncbi:GNAT family N-acetyltransferase, partial [Thermodesulfobacteriota bacterium]
MKNYTIRKIQKKDIKFIEDQSSLHFGEVIAAKRMQSFNWIITGNPYSKTKDDYLIMEEEGKIVAFQGLMPTKLHINGNDYDSYIYHDMMVEPAHRGKGIGTKFMEELHKIFPCFC